MDKRLDRELFIDFKAETARRRTPHSRPVPLPQGEPDWNNRAKKRFQLQVSGGPDQNREQVIKILKNCVARLEGSEPRQAWEPRSESYPYTRMGLALLEAVRLLDVIAEKLIWEQKNRSQGEPE